MHYTFCLRPAIVSQIKEKGLIMIYTMNLDWRWVQNFFNRGGILFLPFWAFFPGSYLQFRFKTPPKSPPNSRKHPQNDPSKFPEKVAE